MWIRLLRSVVLIRCGAGPQVEQPLCELCCHNVETSMRADMEALKEEADAYEAALERLQAEAPLPDPPAEAAGRLAEAQQHERVDRSAASTAM